MKIIKLQTENFKKLSALEITPEGNVIQISGKNGAGKSSVLDAIEAALVGRAGHKDTIKKGAEKGKIVLDMGEFTITRSFTADNQYLKVETKDGFERKSPQKFLDEIIGSISFDPLNFVNAEPKKQRQILLEFTGLKIDDIDAKKKEVYQERTVISRQLKESEAVYNAAPAFPEAPKEKVLVSDLMAGLDSIARKKEAIREVLSSAKDTLDRANDTRNDVMDTQAQISDLETAIKLLNERIALKEKEEVELQQAVRKLDLQAKELMEKEDLDMQESVLKEQINNADSVNSQIEKNLKKAELKKAFADLTKKAFDLTSKIDSFEREKADAISKANLPIPGLSFSEDAVLYNGIVLEGLSSAEKIKIGLAVSMALNPRLRVLRITDGSLLDSDSMKVISEMATTNDFQVWIERVDESGKVGFFIEDGAIKTEEVSNA